MSLPVKPEVIEISFKDSAKAARPSPVKARLEQAALSPRKTPSPVKIAENLQAAEERRQKAVGQKREVAAKEVEHAREMLAKKREGPSTPVKENAHPNL